MKGCQRKVIFLKSTGCDLFDEAYFVVSRESEEKKVSEDSMIAAANRIISDSIELEKGKKRKKIIKLCLRLGLPFIFGAALSAVLLAFI